jgi:hypothetical protein
MEIGKSKYIQHFTEKYYREYATYRLGRWCKDNIKMVARLNSYYQSKRRYFPEDSNLC